MNIYIFSIFDYLLHVFLSSCPKNNPVVHQQEQESDVTIKLSQQWPQFVSHWPSMSQGNQVTDMWKGDSNILSSPFGNAIVQQQKTTV